MRPWSEILTDALESFEGGKRWIRGRLYDEPIRADTFAEGVKVAKSFCAYGAIYKSMERHGELPNSHTQAMCIVIDPIERLMGIRSSLGQFATATNDSAPSFSAVKDMFCLGIKNALEEEEKREQAQVNTAEATQCSKTSSS